MQQVLLKAQGGTVPWKRSRTGLNGISAGTCIWSFFPHGKTWEGNTIIRKKEKGCHPRIRSYSENWLLTPEQRGANRDNIFRLSELSTSSQPGESSLDCQGLLCSVMRAVSTLKTRSAWESAAACNHPVASHAPMQEPQWCCNNANPISLLLLRAFKGCPCNWLKVAHLMGYKPYELAPGCFLHYTLVIFECLAVSVWVSCAQRPGLVASDR